VINSFFSKILIIMVKIYQYSLGYFLGGNCRFEPSCSNYAIQAIKTHGAIKGGFLSIKRILKCNPFCKGGYDPVPKRKNKIKHKS
jgi:hypothetical protein